MDGCRIQGGFDRTADILETGSPFVGGDVDFQDLDSYARICSCTVTANALFIVGDGTRDETIFASESTAADIKKAWDANPSNFDAGTGDLQVKSMDVCTGTTATRFSLAADGERYFDEDLGYEIWRNRSADTGWVDATGAPV